MITLNIDGQDFKFKEEKLQELFLTMALEKAGEDKEQGMMFNSLIGSAFMMMGIKKEEEYKHLSNIEYATILGINTAIEKVSGQSFSIESEKGE